MRLLICAGGTGGGVYPALAVLQAIQVDVDVLWVGGEGGMESQLLERTDIHYRTIPAAGLHGIGLRSLPANMRQLTRGFFASRSLLRDFKPDVLFFTGGYVAVPMALAGWRVPSLLYVPDIEPGLALNTLARFADKITVTSEESIRYFKNAKKICITGYPTRPELDGWTRKRAMQTMKLAEDGPVVLFLGGSKGARSINNAIFLNLKELVDIAQIIHVTGELDWPSVAQKAGMLSPMKSARYHVFPYLHEEMGAALAIADLVVSRAGASTLGEYPLFGLPAVLVPYPHAWQYQTVNAEYLTRHGAAIVIEDDQLTNQLLPTVSGLLGQPQKLEAMRQSMKSLYRPEAAKEIGSQILALGRERS